MEGGKAGINKNVTDRQFSSLTGGVNWPFRCLHAQPSTYCQNERAHEFFILRKSKLQIHKLPEQRLPQAACFCQLRKKTLFVFVNFKSWLPCNFIKSQTGQSYLPIKKLANMFFLSNFKNWSSCKNWCLYQLPDDGKCKQVRGGPFFLPVFARKAIIQRTKKGLFGWWWVALCIVIQTESKQMIWKEV